MAYIKGTWNFPHRVTWALDEELVSNPKTKVVFTELVNGRYYKLVLSSETPQETGLYIWEEEDYPNGDYQWYPSVFPAYDEPIIEGNTITFENSRDYSYEKETNFGLEPQEVSDEFYNWWTTHAIEVPNMSVDLSKYNLSGDTHTVVIKTLDANGNVIDVSNEVVWEKAATIPEGCSYYNDDAGTWYSEGEPFPALMNGDWYENFDGLRYYYSNGSWSCDEAQGQPPINPVILESINGAPVTTLAMIYHGGIGSGVSQVETITIPKSITSISSYAFAWPRGMDEVCDNLTTIIYAGTMEQWNAIELASHWNYGCNTLTVTCADGTITIPAYGS